MLRYQNRIIGVAVTALIISIAAIGVWKVQKKSPAYTLDKAFQGSQIAPVVVIGGGPAGISAGMYTARAKLKTFVFAGLQPGGELTGVREIENWPAKEKLSGLKVMDDLTKQAESFGARILTDSVKSADLTSWPYKVISEGGRTVYALTIIIATGGIAKTLDVPGVKQYWGKGVGSCTICEAPFYKDKDAAIVGGGDTSADRALQLAAYATNVYMIVRDPQMQAMGTVQDYVRKTSNIKVLLNTDLVSIKGDAESVKSIGVVDRKTNQQKEIPVNGVYFAIGFTPNSELFKKCLNTDKDGFIAVSCCNQQTNAPGVFAAGNVATSDKKYGKAGVATASGIKAGMDAIEFLEKLGYTQDIVGKYESQIYVDELNNISLQSVALPTDVAKVINDNPKNLILLFFYTNYCPSCHRLQSMLQSIVGDNLDRVTILKVDATKSSALNKQYGVKGTPHLVLLKGGKNVWQQTRIITAEELKKVIDQYAR